MLEGKEASVKFVQYKHRLELLAAAAAASVVATATAALFYRRKLNKSTTDANGEIRGEKTNKSPRS